MRCHIICRHALCHLELFVSLPFQWLFFILCFQFIDGHFASFWCLLFLEEMLTLTLSKAVFQGLWLN